MSETIAVVATGGTIACTLDEHGALVPTVSAAELVDAALSLSAVPRVNMRAIDSVRLDSSSLTLPDLDDLLQRVHALLADASIMASSSPTARIPWKIPPWHSSFSTLEISQ